MVISKIDLNLVKVVSAISDSGSVSGAAQQLNVTQPAVSNALTRLRALTGDKIFVRVNGRQQPTVFGQELLAVSQEMLSKFEHCLNIQQSFDPETSSRSFRISIVEGLETVVLPKILSHFQDFPCINLNFSHSTQVQAIRDVEIGISDLVIGLLPFNTGSLAVETVLNDCLVLTVGKHNPLIKKASIDKNDFGKLEFVILRPDVNTIQSPELMMQKIGVYRRIAFEVPHATTIPAVVAETKYAGIILERMYKPFVDIFGLKTYPLPFRLPPVGLFIGTNNTHSADKGINWLKEELKTPLKRPSHW